MDFLANAVASTGSFFGAPEFGISERIDGTYNGGTDYNPDYSQDGTLTQSYDPVNNDAMYFDSEQSRILDGNGNPIGSVLGDGTSSSGTSGSGTSAPSQPAYSQDDMNYLNDQERTLRRQLERLLSTKQSGLTQLGDSYNKEVTGANRQRGRALEGLQLQREDTTRDKQGALGDVDKNAYNLNNTLRKLLGRASGTGSSAYQYAAPNLVAGIASGERGGVLENFGENERNLALTERNAKDDFSLLLEELAGRRDTTKRNFLSGVNEQQIGINNNLANNAGDKAQLQGGGYDAVRAAQQPYRSEIQNRESTIDGLFDKFRTPYNNIAPVKVNAPQLRDYTTDRAAINANNQFGTNSGTSPYAQFLQRQREEEQRV